MDIFYVIIFLNLAAFSLNLNSYDDIIVVPEISRDEQTVKSHFNKLIEETNNSRTFCKYLK